jgi:hypothetical protein
LSGVEEGFKARRKLFALSTKQSDSTFKMVYYSSPTMFFGKLMIPISMQVPSSVEIRFEFDLASPKYFILTS